MKTALIVWLVLSFPLLTDAQGSRVFDRLGQKKIVALVDDFTRRCGDNPQLKPFFATTLADKKRTSHFKSQMTNLLCRIAGGDCPLNLKYMRSDYAKMGVKGVHFIAFVEELVNSMNKLAIAEADQNAILKDIVPRWNDTVANEPPPTPSEQYNPAATESELTQNGIFLYHGDTCAVFWADSPKIVKNGADPLRLSANITPLFECEPRPFPLLDRRQISFISQCGKGTVPSEPIELNLLRRLNGEKTTFFTVLATTSFDSFSEMAKAYDLTKRDLTLLEACLNLSKNN